jgi:hypothetical protein
MDKKIKYKYGKEGEKIAAELFKAMGFKVSFIGIEHRRHYIQNLKARDIYSPDLKLYDSEREENFYMEVKSLIITEDNLLVIDKNLFLNYAKYYPENSFLVLYLPMKNRIGMRLIKDLVDLKLANYTIKRSSKNSKLLAFSFDRFRSIDYYGKQLPYSFKFSWDNNKIIEFLSKRRDRIEPFLKEITSAKEHKNNWKKHIITLTKSKR